MIWLSGFGRKVSVGANLWADDWQKEAGTSRQVFLLA